MIREVHKAAVDAVVPPGVTHIGFVATNVAGDVLVVHPHRPAHGVTDTFCKVKIGAGERPSQALIRCLAEQVGVIPASVYPIQTVWVTPNSTSYYFAGLIDDGHDTVTS